MFSIANCNTCLFSRLAGSSHSARVHPHTSLPLTCCLEVLTREQLLGNGRAEEHYMLALGSPISKVCCMNGDVSVRMETSQ